MAPSTLTAVFGKRSRPSAPIVRRMLALLAGPRAAQAAGPGNGAAGPAQEPAPAQASAAVPEVAVPRPAPFRNRRGSRGGRVEGGPALTAGTARGRAASGPVSPPGRIIARRT